MKEESKQRKKEEKIENKRKELERGSKQRTGDVLH